MRNLVKIDPELINIPRTKSMDSVKAVLFYHDYNQCKELLIHNKVNIAAEIRLINAFVLDIPYPAIYEIAEDSSVRYISANIKVKALMNVAGKVVGARLVNTIGFTGKNIGIAVIDTGIYPHADFLRPKNRIKAFVDFINGYDAPYDDNGHGTYVSGIAAGNGVLSRGMYRGIAPDADIIAIKAMNGDGGGDTANILKGLQWVNDNRIRYNIRILALAFGADVNRSGREDALVKAVNRLWENGVIVVVAAGNSGPAQRTINSPGTSARAITVGSSDDKRTLNISDDCIASFSSRGPSGKINKPDLVAPGVDIVSLATDINYIPGKRTGIVPGHISMSGTSVSTPIVAGVCALILEDNPLLKPDQVKSYLKKNAINISHDVFSEGSGMVYIR